MVVCCDARCEMWLWNIPSGVVGMVRHFIGHGGVI